MRQGHSRVALEIANADEESPHYKELMILIVDYTTGYAAETRRAPEDCYPAEGSTIEILEAFWEDGQPIANADLEKVQDETMLKLIEAPYEEDR